jgi:hypothetical protein
MKLRAVAVLAGLFLAIPASAQPSDREGRDQDRHRQADRDSERYNERFSSRYIDRRVRYPEGVTKIGEPNPYEPKVGAPNPYATQGGTPNPYATQGGEPARSGTGAQRR